MAFAFPQFVAEGLHGQDVVFESRHFLFQAPDMHVHRPRGTVIVIAPHGIEQDVAGQHAPGGLEQLFEKTANSFAVSSTSLCATRSSCRALSRRSVP